jgi:hypothetical protein
MSLCQQLGWVDGLFSDMLMGNDEIVPITSRSTFGPSYTCNSAWVIPCWPPLLENQEIELRIKSGPCTATNGVQIPMSPSNVKAVSIRPQQQRCTSMDTGKTAIKDERICPYTI